MRVKVLETGSTYYNYGIVALAADEEVKGGLALHLLETGSAVEPLDAAAKAWRPAADDPAEPEDPAEEELEAPADDELDIDATAADILSWVGDDPDRAEEALAAENAKDKPRSTLVKQLERLAGGGEE
ncbi:hypothetical protein [Streptomyces nymphaeiformis]|uniref:Uncharacterized protein n=1 Tax=Streptomyces nymphaeiformis TaxID=2663842 RepID=A0A7W7U4S9_9ACTN|nr:hypothetical protein [Streptomyces nymphaeiformis]MBB4985030.1 hypothetical protein [Streptomyces nymphaeiformis]